LDQQLDFKCSIYPIIDPWRNVTLLYHKYPRYWEDMRTYSDQLHYAKLYRSGQVYDENIKISYNSN
jgi:hypothetical protein